MNKKKRIVITGATGFIGLPLCRSLLADGYEVTALTRNPQKGRERLGSGVNCLAWDGRGAGEWHQAIDGALGIINLAGESVAGGLWSESYKKRIMDSRTNAGHSISEAILAAANKPEFLIQASATGIYGHRHDEVLDEFSSKGKTFLAEVVDLWEASVAEVVASEVRVAIPRIGVVLGAGGGMLGKMTLPFRLFAGGPVGSGKQWISWIHINDVVQGIRFLMDGSQLAGHYNFTAPQPVRMAEFCRHFAAALNRPSWLPVPAFAIRLLLGQMADETVLLSQRVIPRQLLESGFSFNFPELKTALGNLLD